MYELAQLGLGAYLCVLSALDIWKRRLPVWFLVGGVVAVLLVHLLGGPSFGVEMAAGGAVGIVFLMVSKVTEESFGYGDSLVIFIMGIYLGFWDLLAVLAAAFLLSALFAAIWLVRRRFNRRTRYPFVPFLLVAYLLWLYF